MVAFIPIILYLSCLWYKFGFKSEHTIKVRWKFVALYTENLSNSVTTVCNPTNNTSLESHWKALHLHLNCFTKKVKNEKEKRRRKKWIFERKTFELKRLGHLIPCTMTGSKMYMFLGEKYNILGDIRGFRKMFFFVFLFRFSLFRETF